jgi:outer membrane protein OmpA-like peptidoglycan-associated protein
VSNLWLPLFVAALTWIMAGRRTFSAVTVALSLIALAHGQGLPPGSPKSGEGGFPQPSATPETVADTQDFPYLPALAGARLISTRRVDGPLELRPATADDEAVLAGMSYVQKSYDPSAPLRAGRPASQTATAFISVVRDGLFAAGWKLIAVTKLDEVATPETVSVAAHYSANGRLIFARLSHQPDGPYQANVADVGDEDWASALAKDCRIRVHSIQFDLDRPSLRSEATPTLEQLAGVLKARSAPAVEIQGHTDNVGAAGDAARQVLSEARAKVVAAWLVEHGVPAAKVTSKGYGKTRPVAANDSDLGRAMNRRIEIVRPGCSR